MYTYVILLTIASSWLDHPNMPDANYLLADAVVVSSSFKTKERCEEELVKTALSRGRELYVKNSSIGIIAEKAHHGSGNSSLERLSCAAILSPD